MTTDERGRGERALMCAVLEDAVDCLSGRNAAQWPKLLAETRAWFADRDERWLFSFERICATLGLDPDHFRAQLRARAASAPQSVDAAEAARPGRRVAARQDDVTRMILSGHRLRVVARALGISIPQVSTLSRRLATRIRASRDADICRLHQEGWTPRALAERFHLSYVRVTRICVRGGSGGAAGGNLASPPARTAGRG